ncbi:uncharacterized protein LOC115748724 [Rhodamnia argentea]|uniref:Uncharacterized protein LOC115748724 n=1 Tax=Rhodamnia argentea TaxID=178133 RepID=A0ABM3HPH3_9MYRT|nr:uncharacterized protein LOC115748724 [Rhodamnia argentea]
MSPSIRAGNGSEGAGAANGRNYLEHEVTKMDTLAGIAIKYGVEVADIKRMNGLATDLQMFALKTLRVPLPGRHPPSATLSDGSGSSRENGCKKGRSHRTTSNVLDSLESLRLKSPQKVTSTMNTLQSYYGLDSQNKRSAEGMEMTVYGTGAPSIYDNGLPPKASTMPESTYKTQSSGFSQDDGVADFVPLGDSGEDEGEKSSEKSVRRRQKAEPDLGVGTPERVLKEENSGGSSSSFSTITGKGLALRPKSASRTSLISDGESSWSNAIPLGIGDSIMVDDLVGVRKASSLSSLQDQDGRRSSSIWPASKWNLKADLPVLSAASITGPLLEGLPIPISGRRNKAALD